MTEKRKPGPKPKAKAEESAKQESVKPTPAAPSVKTSKGSVYIYSTLSTDQLYTSWEANKKGGPHIKKGEVFIAGKANVATEHLLTPKGMCTAVTEEQLKFLKNDSVFNRHVEAGYLLIETRKFDADEAAKDMTEKDPGAPLTPDDFEDGKAPKTEAAK